MSFSTMSSREKTIVAILGVVILVALVGIGVLVAKLVAGNQTEAITVPATAEVATPQPTVTLVAAPSLAGLSQLPESPISAERMLVAQEKGVGPIAPVMIADQPLNAGHRYQIEISAADGSQVAIQGSWGQSATSTAGEVAAPQIKFFEGKTPYKVDVVAPVANPDLWSCSVSASIKVADPLAKSPTLVISIWDVTGTK